MLSENTYILAIESSCDDTACAVLHNNTILSNIVATQKIHEEYGGVVPELASRAHQQNIVPVVDKALKQANISKKQLHAIAFTAGPGLMGSLLVGVSFAKSLAMALNIPLIEVNHMQAHMIPKFPFLGLTISGGHTQIVKVNDFFDMEVIGETIDDAIGEAFDKSAKTLGLSYPGGPLIDKYSKIGDPKAFTFSKPKVANLNFSFSGFKTAVLYLVQRQTKIDPDFVTKNLNDLCASIQYTLVEIILDKLKKAVKQTGIKTIAIGGGVSANSGIREMLQSTENRLGWKVHIPKFEYTTDNAGMIGITGYYKYLNREFSDLSVTASSRAKI